MLVNALAISNAFYHIQSRDQTLHIDPFILAEMRFVAVLHRPHKAGAQLDFFKAILRQLPALFLFCFKLVQDTYKADFSRLFAVRGHTEDYYL